MTEQERQAFMRWLRQGIESSEAMQRQFEKMQFPASVREALTKKEKLENAGRAIVLRMLEATSIESI